MVFCEDKGLWMNKPLSPSVRAFTCGCKTAQSGKELERALVGSESLVLWVAAAEQVGKQIEEFVLAQHVDQTRRHR